MVLATLKNLFGTSNDRFIKSLDITISHINSLEKEIATLTDTEISNKTLEFKNRILNNQESLDSILPEAFATCREAAKRTIGMRHFDVQLIGGITLHKGMISEMKTGEGKTLVATLAAYLNALEGKGCHVITVNDYLAQRDAQWMGKLYNALGLSVGCITANISAAERKAAYNADITHGTNNEFGFDYLRDNMHFQAEKVVQRDLHFAIVDEVDSILIDEARTPLIISGPAEDSSDLYQKINHIIPELDSDDFEMDEKSKTTNLTDAGIEKVEELMKKNNYIKEGSSLYNMENISIVHHVNQALKAHKLFTKDIDYIIRDDQVMIIDEFTGRVMDGRRYSEGLHQALEAKENVAIQNENQTLASTTFQNYFRLYNKLSGMTGTASTEREEFAHIYGLEVVEIPTHRPITRIDEDDAVYINAEHKYNAIIETIKEGHAKKQPFLVGTISIEKSELVSKLLKKAKIPHQVLNAKYHEKEAEIIAQAGRAGAVTIATNMAGRGTDIVLGGNPEFLINSLEEKIEDPEKLEEEIAKITKELEEEAQIVKEAGGLFVIGTERHESRRIDNQLRGRSGRQGDAGYTKFFLSMEDDLLRIFGSDTMKSLLAKLGMNEGEALYHPWITKAIARAQKKVEEHNYDIRKNLLKYDDVMNDQRTIIYDQRKHLISEDEVTQLVNDLIIEINEDLITTHIPKKSYKEQWDSEGLAKEIKTIYNTDIDIPAIIDQDGIDEKGLLSIINDKTSFIINNKRNIYGANTLKTIEKRILLFTLDELWKNHLLAMDHLKQGINLRAYGQKDPLNEYKKEAFLLFEAMLTELGRLTINRICHIEINITNAEIDKQANSLLSKKEHEQESNIHLSRFDPAIANKKLNAAQQQLKIANNNNKPNFEPSINPIRNKIDEEERDPNNPNSWGKIARNDKCPCGSGKKYKACHGI